HGACLLGGRWESIHSIAAAINGAVSFSTRSGRWSIYPAHVPRPHNGARIGCADEAESALPLAALGAGHDPVARRRAGRDDERPPPALPDAACLGLAQGRAAAAPRRVRRLGARLARRRRARRLRRAGHLSAPGSWTRAAPAGAQGTLGAARRSLG